MNILHNHYYLKPSRIPYGVWLGLPPGHSQTLNVKALLTFIVSRIIVKIKSYFIILEPFLFKNISKRFFFRKKVLLLNPKY